MNNNENGLIGQRHWLKINLSGFAHSAGPGWRMICYCWNMTHHNIKLLRIAIPRLLWHLGGRGLRALRSSWFSFRTSIWALAVPPGEGIRTHRGKSAKWMFTYDVSRLSGLAELLISHRFYSVFLKIAHTCWSRSCVDFAAFTVCRTIRKSWFSICFIM